MEYNEDQVFPVYFECNESQFDELNELAGKLLNIPNEETESYASKIYSESSSVYFIVNREVAELVDINKCITFEELKIKQHD